jgi:formylglycine-generating enzyme
MRRFVCILLLAVMAREQTVQGQTTPAVSVQMYAGLTISGTVGASYTVQFVPSLGRNYNWATLATFVLTNSPYLWMDTSNPGSSQRFYRVVPTTTINAPAPAGMVLIPAGSFVMGDALDGESDAPTNTEYISALYMDATLVPGQLWSQVYQWAVNNGYSFDNAGAGQGGEPVQSINWFDAVKWCNARSQMNGATAVYYVDQNFTQVYQTGESTPYANWSAAGYRLPTEAEWEKAARAGLAENRFPWGNTISESQANYYGDPIIYSYDLGPAGYNPVFGSGIGICTSPVTYYPPNPYGLYDMAGNLFEWCWDWYGPYVNGVQINPTGPTAGSFRVLRGGSWLVGAYDCRSANRSYYYPALGGNEYGFRAVLMAANQ